MRDELADPSDPWPPMLSIENPQENEVLAMSSSAVLSKTFELAIPEDVRVQQGWTAGQAFAFLPKGAGVLLVPVPTREQLRGIAAGADTENYRDRDDRY